MDKTASANVAISKNGPSQHEEDDDFDSLTELQPVRLECFSLDSHL